MPHQDAGLTYDRQTERWSIRGLDLHCGDGLQVRIGGRWLPVRVEHDSRHGWILNADDDRVRILPSRALPARLDP